MKQNRVHLNFSSDHKEGNRFSTCIFIKFFLSLSGVFLLIFFLSSIVLGAPEPPEALQKAVEQNIRHAQKVQKETETWAEERASLLEQLRTHKRNKQWLEHQIKKHEIYIQKQRAAVDKLKQNQKDARQVRMELEPYLDTLLVRIEEMISKDLPFLSEEREQRLQALKDILNDHHPGLADKTARLFEALQVEARYSQMIEESESVISLKGVSTQVSLFRLGRLALFYQTPDGRQTGWFDRNSGSWEPLPSEYNRTIRQAVEMAEKRRTPSLLDLPVGRVPK